MKEIYIVHVDGYIGSYMPNRRCPTIGYAPKDKFVDFCRGLKEDYPGYRLRGIDNEEIRSKIRQRIIQDKVLAKLRVRD